ncbi:MAG: hypothetical protein KF680_07150 [Cryobacterium sp.]|nr:hypothetical protein [Cryobacterium sp.]
MTRLRVGPVSTRRALFSHMEDAVRAALVARPARGTVRDVAFRRYLRKVRAIMRSDPAHFEVIESRLLARGHTSSIIELTLRTDAAAEPGDMLHLLWRNTPERIAQVHAEAADGTYWSTPIPHRPSRRQHYSAETLLAEVIDLGAPGEPVTLDTAARITPRFFTVSGLEVVEGRSLVRIQVTLADAWPSRASAFLHSLQPGDELAARVLPHPHRVPLGGGGIAVATGSGAASVFAALRAGAADIRLFWGVGNKRLEPWVVDELHTHTESGRLAELTIVRSPDRVTGALATKLARAHVGADWIYVSGNEDMGRDVDALLSGLFGADTLRAMSNELRYIVST